MSGQELRYQTLREAQIAGLRKHETHRNTTTQNHNASMTKIRSRHDMKLFHCLQPEPTDGGALPNLKVVEINNTARIVGLFTLNTAKCEKNRSSLHPAKSETGELRSPADFVPAAYVSSRGKQTYTKS